MKKLYFPALFILMLCCSSCVDIEERYDFNKDGSCNVVYGVDMSRAVSVLTNLLSDSVRETPQFSLVKDTTINFYNALPDSIANKMNAEEIKLAQGSDLAVKMNLKNNVMKVNLTHKASTTAELQYYLQHISSLPINSPAFTVVNGSSKINNALDAGQRFTAGQDYYVYEISDNKFYRSVDKTKFNLFLKKVGSKLSVAKAMLIDMPCKVVLRFARPVKKINNSKAMLSADRRTVTLVTSMDEVMKNPSLMNLKIDL
ncbi:hypothetical protein DYU05_03410 [Mucilaginibacter terrenus]|uniref:Uncharacterized protein n=1 Tax=Mucilaginibacter terrenus TaxID=2482727 RepID=A0A3E2NUM5_9SPHI|nr:hypothetical protein [Mucilaginibacter terrenus]RFZ84669.1 hypothetical protein DYU05_03410 [Mucilaginibacter terrenus]